MGKRKSDIIAQDIKKKQLYFSKKNAPHKSEEG